jgi:hypothetical protein
MVNFTCSLIFFPLSLAARSYFVLRPYSYFTSAQTPGWTPGQNYGLIWRRYCSYTNFLSFFYDDEQRHNVVPDEEPFTEINENASREKQYFSTCISFSAFHRSPWKWMSNRAPCGARVLPRALINGLWPFILVNFAFSTLINDGQRLQSILFTVKLWSYGILNPHMHFKRVILLFLACCEFYHCPQIF